MIRLTGWNDLCCIRLNGTFGWSVKLALYRMYTIVLNISHGKHVGFWWRYTNGIIMPYCRICRFFEIFCCARRTAGCSPSRGIAKSWNNSRFQRNNWQLYFSARGTAERCEENSPEKENSLWIESWIYQSKRNGKWWHKNNMKKNRNDECRKKEYRNKYLMNHNLILVINYYKIRFNSLFVVDNLKFSGRQNWL